MELWFASWLQPVESLSDVCLCDLENCVGELQKSVHLTLDTWLEVFFQNAKVTEKDSLERDGIESWKKVDGRMV